MAWVERRVTRTTQPQDGVGVDWSNPIADRLVVLTDYSGNPLQKLPVLSGGSKSTAITTRGKFVKNSSANSNYALRLSPAANEGLTFFAVIERNLKGYSDPTGGRIIQVSSIQYDGGYPSGIRFESYANGLQLTFSIRRANYAGDASVGVSIPASLGTTFQVVIGTYDKVNGARLFVNGVLVGTSPSSDQSIDRNFYDRLDMTGGALQDNLGGTYVSGIIERSISDAEIKSLSENPWQIFEPEVERIWISDYIATGGLTQVQSDASLNYVLQAITFNSQGGMYSILGLVNSDINSSYNVTESRVNSSSLNYVINAAVTQDQPENYNVRAGVDSTQNETYNILGAVQQSQNEEYNVLASLSSTQGSTYNVRSALSKDQGFTYFISESTYREQLVDYVIRSQQHNDQSATYSILSANSVGNNADLNYVISALIQQDQQENYLVRSSAHQETNGVYTVRSSAESTTEGSYAVRASLTGDATLDYSIRAEVNSSGSMSYTVRASLSKDQGLMYDILAANNVSSSSGGSYIIQATTANNTSCSYQIQGEVIDVPLTNAEMQQLYAWVSELVTKSATKEEIATAVWSKPTSELTVENSIGKWLMQKVLTVSKFLALK